jgi:hypothetical protein
VLGETRTATCVTHTGTTGEALGRRTSVYASIISSSILWSVWGGRARVLMVMLLMLMM